MIEYSKFVNPNSKSFVYLLCSPLDNSVFYIGKSNNPKKRYNKHLSQLNSKTLKNNFIKHLRSIGLKPKMLIVYGGSEKDSLCEEVALIRIYNNLNIPLKNMTAGGDGGDTMSNRKLSIDARRKISLSKIGKKRPDLKNESKRKAVLQIDPKTNQVINRFDSVVLASKITGCSKTNIAKMSNGSIKNTVKLVGGYIWAYEDKV